MGAILALIGRVFGLNLIYKLFVAGSLAWLARFFVISFFGLQVIGFIGSLIFTVLLAVNGTDYILQLLDFTGLKETVNTSLDALASVGSDVDSVLSRNAFGTSVTNALNYFNFFPFINAITSSLFAIFSLKLNIYVFKLSTAAFRGVGR